MGAKITLIIMSFIFAVANFGGAAKHYDQKKYTAFGFDLMLGIMMVFIVFINYIHIYCM